VRSDDRAEALRQIVQWADAYSGEVYEPISDEQLALASKALAGVGISMEGLHARWARTLVEGIGRLAREELAAAEGREVTH
jgi:hypothetical protein